MRTVEITRQPVELFKILKFEGLAASGAEAKLAVAAGQVSVNGEVETRKRRKIVDGDIIVFADETLQIRLA
jgi:ribosome-associated protein